MWVKLVNQGDWGSTDIRFSKDGDKVGPGNLKVMWPDGSVETLHVRMKKVSNTVGDMGHDYTSVSDVPHVTIDHHGYEIEMPLHRIGVQVWRDE